MTVKKLRSELETVDEHLATVLGNIKNYTQAINSSRGLFAFRVAENRQVERRLRRRLLSRKSRLTAMLEVA